MKNIPFKFFPKNTRGRDFVVGDIHGMFSALEDLLEKVDFNPGRDRVFAVGDLIDRGAESERALEFLAKPWFFSIMGNHESILLDAEYNPSVLDPWIRYNGGKWWLNVSKKIKRLFKKHLAELAIAFEVETEKGSVGIVHADIPMGLDWKTFVSKLSLDFELRNYALWSRMRYKNYKLTGQSSVVQKIDLLVVGHTPIHTAFKIENIYYIDTGATYIENKKLSTLSLLEIQPIVKLHQLSTYAKKKFAWFNRFT